MFKKLKDKLAEEVKSSPQRIQQFAQAAQAAVTSASSSISDITNNDLFSIGDNDNPQSQPVKTLSSSQPTPFQEVPLVQGLPTSNEDFSPTHDNMMDNQKQRRLSNSSFASDVSFRLPSYESPSMYHLQSDMEISASEAEERGFPSTGVSLDRVTKDQLYAAYRRTQERYTKYRTQYANLAHHYKLLERENAKARSVLVETQDKALRRISELREQCALEQSAKAHLEKALRVDIEEKNMKIESLNTKISILQNNEPICNDDQNDNKKKTLIDNENVAQLINLSTDNDVKQTNEDTNTAEINSLNNKIEKMEQLINKYKESLKTTKEKNSQMTTELQKLANDLEMKNKESELLKTATEQLNEAKQQIQELNIGNEELQNKINSYDFRKTKEISTLELDLQKAKEEILELNGKIDIFSKREEEYAISLAENKLSIHKELESKETEIKSLKERLSSAEKEYKSVNIILGDYKNNLSKLEEERTKLISDINELKVTRNKVAGLEEQIQLLTQKSQSLENSKLKADEQYKCLQLQMKQETAEKLAMVDRNVYLENRIAQLIEENTKKSTQITKLENYLQELKTEIENSGKNNTVNEIQHNQTNQELNLWKTKYSTLESEIQEEREELIKLQSEIEKLLRNHELIQTQNSDLSTAIIELKSQNAELQQKLARYKDLKQNIVTLSHNAKSIREIIDLSSEETTTFNKEINHKFIPHIKAKLRLFDEFNKSHESLQIKYQELIKNYEISQDQLKNISNTHETMLTDLNRLDKENQNLKLQVQEYNKIKDNYSHCQKDFDEVIKKHESTEKELQILQNENVILKSVVQEYEKLQNEYKKFQKDVSGFEEKQRATATALEASMEENKNIKSQLDTLNELQNNNQLLQKTLKEITEKNQCDIKVFKDMQKDNEDLKGNLQNYQTELEILRLEQKTYNSKIKENEELMNKIKHELADKEKSLSNLKHTVESVSKENVSLKSQSESITKNVKDLESEIDDVRKAHAEMEAEKDKLNLIIEQLELKQQQSLITAEVDDKNIQTNELCNVPDIDQSVPSSDSIYTVEKTLEKEDNIEDMQILQNNIEVLNSKNSEFETEIRVLKDINAQLSNKILEQQKDSTDDVYIENSEKYKILNNQCELLKEENRRLQSDVEGLQTYLTRISKENGDLNDRLRELIASGENSLDKNEIQVSDLTEFQKEVELGKQRIDDLIRENSLLLEENLELKDQIISQNYDRTESTTTGNNNDVELKKIKEKYNELLDTKRKMEQRLTDLEVINKSVNGNMQQVQDSNQKLRLANEKLERRLDESLVSLRHLHSLQENTELEYLRNILFEYLTGSGTHSIMLAKVLSAVVKFDDRQTQQVLQKEKERQGLLRQLGLM